MAVADPEDVLLIKEPCPNCSKEMTFPETAPQVTCPHCGQSFDLLDEPTAADQREALGAAPIEPPPPPPPVVPAAPAARAQESIALANGSVIVGKPGSGPVVGSSDPLAAPSMGDDDEPGPLGAGDVASAADAKRGGGRKPIPLAPKGPGVTDFIWRTREYQWVVKGGEGNPYGPTSISTTIFLIVAESRDAGIDPVDLAVELRRRLLADGKECRSILQRIVMVCERICCNANVALMERVGTTEKIRVVERHRIEIPSPPADMVGAKRKRDLDTARAAAVALATQPPAPPEPPPPPPPPS